MSVDYYGNELVPETNKFKRAWIWLWYNDVFRIFGVVLGGHLLISIPLLKILGVNGHFIKDFALYSYVAILMLAFMLNDYSNLRRIGLDEYRRPLKEKSSIK
jgi:hypothetical protein